MSYDESYYREPWMTDGQWKCWQMVADIFGGFHHVQGKVHPHGRGICLNTRLGCFATFDFNDLTRAVFLAHDRAIRFEIRPSGPGMLALCLSFRGKRDGHIYERHPTIDSAIADWRKTHTLDSVA